jgi:hypothetical protein
MTFVLVWVMRGSHEHFAVKVVVVFMTFVRCPDGMKSRSPSPDRQVECPYNRAHKMPALSLKHHITKCPDRPK